MRRLSKALASLALLVGVAGGCVEVERPGGVTGPGTPDPPTGPPFFRIAQPVNGQVVLRSDLTTDPGFRMLATGDLPVDHTVAVEAYQNNHLLPFSSHFVRIEAPDIVSLEFFLLGSEQHLTTATAAKVYLEVREATGLVVSRDSVVLTVR